MKWRHHNTRTTKQLVDRLVLLESLARLVQQNVFTLQLKRLHSKYDINEGQIKTYRSTVQLIWPFRLLRGSKNQRAASTMGLRAVGTVSNKLSNAEQSSNWTPPPHRHHKPYNHSTSPSNEQTRNETVNLDISSLHGDETYRF